MALLAYSSKGSDSGCFFSLYQMNLIVFPVNIRQL